MHSIEKTPYGLLIKLSGSITPAEMTRWVDDEQWFLPSLPPHRFGMIVDTRELEPLSAASQVELQKGLSLFRDKGLQRSAVIVDSATAKEQFKRTAKESGIDAWERYIDASKKSNWQQVAQAWVVDGTEPPQA
jgi:hypothetical protein